MKREDSDLDSDYMYDIIDTICKKYGPRYSCSQAERDANLWIKNELGKFSDETFIDEFKTRPAMYPQGFIKFAGVFGGISPIFMILQFPFPIFSAIFVFLGLWVLYSEMMLMKGWIGPFFKKKTSSNVFGIIKPTGEVKFRIIFEGHTDSAKEMNIASYPQKLRKWIAIIGLYFLIHTIIFSLWKFIAQIIGVSSIALYDSVFISWTTIDLAYFLSLIVIYPFFIWILKGFLGKTVVLGANDNLAATAVSLAIGKYLSQNRLKHIEVWVGSQGSEEVGDKGAGAFVKKYGEQGILDNSYTVVLECCGAAEAIAIIERDMHGAVYDKEVNSLLDQAYNATKIENPKMLKLKKVNLKIGATDACQYIHEGYRASAMFGVEEHKNKAVNWHSINDAPENISKKVLKDFLEISLKFVELVDKKYH
ncbi:MAG: M28 family peptidase [Promethearchaeota archaeon]